MTNVEINITRLSGDWSKSITGYKRKIEKWCMAAIAKNTSLKKKDVSLSVVLADDHFVHDLNHTYRGKNKPTNVLSFKGEGQELGDIILAYETVKKEAKAQGKSFTAHTAHLVVHGVLHVFGHDHENEKEAKVMEKEEVAILAKLGFTSPYANEVTK